MPVVSVLLLYVLGYCACLTMFMYVDAPMTAEEKAVSGHDKFTGFRLAFAALFWPVLLPTGLVFCLFRHLEHSEKKEKKS